MRFHVVGIGGAGMSAVAQLLLAAGHEVSGSDSADWPLAKLAAAKGATVVGRFDRANVVGADVVVRSAAYHEDHAEVMAARAAGIPVWRRQDAWRFLAEGKRVVAVAGTHGKTTTTGLVFTALRAGGLEPSLLCGGELRDLGSNAHAGSGDILVVEADEYDRAFLSLDPEVAVVTNVEHDHVDLFPTPADVAAAFRDFVARLVAGGSLVACADDAGATELAAWSHDALPGRHITTYGTATDARWRIEDLSLESALTAFELRPPEGPKIAVHLRLLGVHNARNAAAAISAAEACGVPANVAALALASFGGTSRRLETLGEEGLVRVLDDYAHHPTEIRASLEAVRPSVHGRLIAVFQPHTPSRLRAFLADFADALRGADAAIVVETFASAREPSDEGAGAKELARRSGATYAANNDDAARAIARMAHAGDVVVVLGAGDVREAGERALVLLGGRR